MKHPEADLSLSLKDFIDRNKPNWGIRVRFPNGRAGIVYPMDEAIADLVLVQGFNVAPPRNEHGGTAISAKKYG